MTAPPRPLRIGLILAGLLAGQPATALAHAFGERYDLPAPLGYFVGGAAATVGLSFVVAAVVMRAVPARMPSGRIIRLGPLLPALNYALRLLGVLLLAMVVIAGYHGSLNPETNPAPILVWIVWWVGLSLVAAFAGNVWPALDPWRTLFDAAQSALRRLGFTRGLSLGWRYPATLGAWPAVMLLLLFVWLEVIYPHSALPRTVATMALAWSAISLFGMIAFGGEAWRRNADVFHRYFETLGRFAPLGRGPDTRSLVLRAPGTALIDRPVGSFAAVAFVLAMLSTVLFDGLLGTQAMIVARRSLAAVLPALDDAQGYFLGTAGLVAVWAMFLGAYVLACRAAAPLAQRPAAHLERLFALTLVPIAIAYNLAHYFSYLAVHGQLLIPLLSDPLGRGWNLFGTAHYYPDIGLIGARATWYLAVGSIVTGHVVSVWLAHRIALRELRAVRPAVLASVPLTVLMIAYTAISLAIMAEPLVQFTEAAVTAPAR